MTARTTLFTSSHVTVGLLQMKMMDRSHVTCWLVLELQHQLQVNKTFASINLHPPPPKSSCLYQWFELSILLTLNETNMLLAMLFSCQYGSNQEMKIKFKNKKRFLKKYFLVFIWNPRWLPPLDNVYHMTVGKCFKIH